ncbi:MAG: helix-turn-helix domain-containing protein, partial [Candidatus Brocadiae bacterium]|nr:helix-turn-helix domain-containing protein [Candidatus Brocadiia bacterium]
MSFDIGGTQVYSLDEVSLTLGVSPAQLRRCIRRGELLARKVGNHYFVTTPNLLAFLAGPKPPGPGGGATAPAPEGELPAPAAPVADGE